jgi:hypothetical protein
MCGAGNIDILNQATGQISQSDAQTECKTFNKREGLGSYWESADNVNWSGMTATVVGGDMSPSVTCTVDNCQYWGNDDVCQADSIEVTGSGADHCRDTTCRTFHAQ